MIQRKTAASLGVVSPTENGQLALSSKFYCNYFTLTLTLIFQGATNQMTDVLSASR